MKFKLCILGGFLMAGSVFSQAPRPVNKDKELMITSLSVVESARATSVDGPWHFKTLMKNLAKTDDPSAFVLAWLAQWDKPISLNGQNSAARTAINANVITPWVTASAASGLPPGKLDFAKAPFRLLAIVNRIDLANEAPGDTDAGEGRFIFCAINPAGAPLQFTVIFEFRQVAANFAQIKDWAERWHNLGTHSAFDEGYLETLNLVTDRFAGPNATLNQIRTNEIALLAPWQLREFHLGEDGFLQQAVVAQTPPIAQNNAPLLGAWLAANAADITAQTFRVPLTFGGMPFLGADITNQPTAWRSTFVSNDVRHLFSLNTCNGCHGVEAKHASETVPNLFTHVRPRAAGAVASLSRFLTGTTPEGAPDPVVATTIRQFNDLEFRKSKLEGLLARAPSAVSGLQPSVLAVRPPLKRSSRVH